MLGGDSKVARPGRSRAGLLPMTGIWQSLPRHTLMLMDDAMEHVEEDYDQSAASKSAPTCDQARSAAAAAAAEAEAEADAAAAAHLAAMSGGAPQSTKKLNEALALAIFQARPCKKGRRTNLSATLGRRYGMTAKAVRDVWNVRTWASVTKPFWTAEERVAYEVRKMQRAHPNPHLIPIAPAMHLPCTYSPWWPRADRA